MNSLKKYPLTEGKDTLNMKLTVKEVVDELENIRYTTYGVMVTDETGNILFTAPDVDTKKEYVERFIKLCAGGDVRLIHIPDLLEDYLA